MKINSKTKQLNKKKRNESRETRTETMGVRSGSVRESRKGGGGGRVSSSLRSRSGVAFGLFFTWCVSLEESKLTCV